MAPNEMTPLAVPRPCLLVPGIPTLGLGVVRYRVAGGGSTVFTLDAGDSLRVRDREGRQPGKLVAFGKDAKAGPAALGARAEGAAEDPKAILARGDESTEALAAALKRRGLELGRAKAASLFGPESQAGAETTFTAEKPMICILAAPGGATAVDAQNPPTDLEAVVTRGRPPTPGEAVLPEPLADPRLDLRVDRCTARSYEVKAGEFIQIIDVEGRECSDF